MPKILNYKSYYKAFKLWVVDDGFISVLACSFFHYSMTLARLPYVMKLVNPMALIKKRQRIRLREEKYQLQFEDVSKVTLWPKILEQEMVLAGINGKVEDYEAALVR